MDEPIDLIAALLTDDPDIFNEMVSTGSIAMVPGVAPTKKSKKKKKNKKSDKDGARSVTGQPEEGDSIFYS